MSKTMTFKEAADAWYAVADKYSEFGAYDTEPRAEFAQIVIDLAHGQEPVVPTRASGISYGGTSPTWQLYSEMKGNGLAAIALTRAARKVVKIGLVDREGAIRYAEYQGWA
jgi:hypothetical protein